MNDILVSIVSFNTKNLLRDCLKSVLNQKFKGKVEVWVVDNHSEDGSAEMVKEEFAKVSLTQNKDNIGFAKAQNMVLKKANTEYCLVLNPDTKMEEDTLEKMVKFMEENPECGIASCKLLYYDGKLQSNGGDLPFGFALLVWLYNLEWFGNFPNFHRTEKKYYDKVREVGWVGGTFMFIRKEVFKSIGFLDEKIFMYFEDTEFCYRAKSIGFKVMINPEVVVRHVSGASSKDPRFSQWAGEFKGLLYFYDKYFGAFAAFAVKILIYISLVLRISAFSILGKGVTAKTYAKVLLSI